MENQYVTSYFIRNCFATIAIIFCLIACFEEKPIVPKPTNVEKKPEKQPPPNSSGTNSKPPVKKDPLKNKILGDFSYEIDPVFQVVRFKRNDSVLKRVEFLEELASNNARALNLRRLVNEAITVFYANNSAGIKLKSPPISQQTKNQPFFWLAQPHTFANQDIQETYKDYLVHCNPSFTGGDKNSNDYKQRFLGIVDENGVHLKKVLGTQTFQNAAVFFINLGSPPDQLVIPCPFDSNFQLPINRILLHVGSYAKYLQDNPSIFGTKQRIESFWLALGIAANSFTKSNSNQTIYLHTHGTGTRYFHFRIDVNLYDYNDGYAPELTSEPRASLFYKKVFNE